MVILSTIVAPYPSPIGTGSGSWPRSTTAYTSSSITTINPWEWPFSWSIPTSIVTIMSITIISIFPSAVLSTVFLRITSKIASSVILLKSGPVFELSSISTTWPIVWPVSILIISLNKTPIFSSPSTLINLQHKWSLFCYLLQLIFLAWLLTYLFCLPIHP